MLFTMSKRWNRFALLFLLLILAATVDGAYYRNKVYPGVYVNHIHLGGKSLQEVQAILRTLEITLLHPDRDDAALTMPLGDLGITVAVETMSGAAFRCGRLRRWPEVYIERLRLRLYGIHLKLHYQTNQETLLHTLSALADHYHTSPVDAHVRLHQGRFALVPEINGTRLAADDLAQRITGTLDNSQAALTVEVPLENISAKTTKATYKEKGILALTSSYTTIFDGAQTERVHNIRQACQALSGSLIAPGAVFSVNAVVGDTTPAKGYKKAPVIMGGELVPGYGGGLCQVSTTLYNAVLLAGMDVLERHPHQLAVPYVRPGRDATISYPTKDLSFRNNTGRHILIMAEVKETELTFYILGAAEAKGIEIETTIHRVYLPPQRTVTDFRLRPGQAELMEGDPGFSVETRRIFRENGTLLHSELLSNDHYSPYPITIRRGPAN